MAVQGVEFVESAHGREADELAEVHRGHQTATVCGAPLVGELPYKTGLIIVAFTLAILIQ